MITETSYYGRGSGFSKLVRMFLPTNKCRDRVFLIHEEVKHVPLNILSTRVLVEDEDS